MSKSYDMGNEPSLFNPEMEDPKYVPFEEMDIPEIVYKFRDWKNNNHKRIISHREVFMAAPSSFEDEHDCRVPIRYDLLTDSEIFHKYLKGSLEMNPSFSMSQHFSFANQWKEKGLLRDPKRNAEFEAHFFEEFNKRTGVLSLTAVRDSHDIWNYYGANGKGFAIGFKSVSFFDRPGSFGRGGAVQYFEELPIIKATDTYFKQSILQVYSKLSDWKFEKEYRIMSFDAQSRSVVIEPESYSELLLGWDISHDDKEDILAQVRLQFPEITVLQAVLGDDEKINFETLEVD